MNFDKYVSWAWIKFLKKQSNCILQIWGWYTYLETNLRTPFQKRNRWGMSKMSLCSRRPRCPSRYRRCAVSVAPFARLWARPSVSCFRPRRRSGSARAFARTTWTCRRFATGRKCRCAREGRPRCWEWVTTRRGTRPPECAQNGSGSWNCAVESGGSCWFERRPLVEGTDAACGCVQKSLPAGFVS